MSHEGSECHTQNMAGLNMFVSPQPQSLTRVSDVVKNKHKLKISWKGLINRNSKQTKQHKRDKEQSSQIR